MERPITGGGHDWEWDIGVATVTAYDADGFGSTQVDVPGEQQAGVAPYENHFPYGLYARPLEPTVDGDGNPDPTSANQVLYALEGGIGHSFPLENPAVIQLLPTIKPGETLFYGPKGQIIRTTIDGQMLIWCPAPDGSGEVDFNMAWGSEGVTWNGRWGSFSQSDAGVTVTAPGGASLEMGAIGGAPGPLSAVSSSVTVKAGNIALEGNVTIGAGSIGVAPGVNGTFLLAKLAAIDSALKAIIQLIPTGIAPTSGGPVTYATLALAIAAVAASIPATPVNLYTDANGTF